LLDCLAGDELGPLYEVVASSGLRRGEALGLHWSDVELDVGVVHVRRQLVQLAGQHPCESCDGHNGVMFSTPKTSSGVRTIELDAHTMGVLLDQRFRQDIDREQLGTAYADHGLVFAREDGNPLDPSMVTKRFGVLCEEAGVRKIRLHDLRHGAASLRLAAGVDLGIVSKILGHSSVTITADTATCSKVSGGTQRSEPPRWSLGLPPKLSGSQRAPDLGLSEPGSRFHRSDSGPRGARTHNPRIKRTQDRGHCDLYQ
jgi:integrase